MAELSEEAKRICKENYTKNCHRCPIRPQCTSPVGPGYEAQYRWLNVVNEAADKVGTGTQGVSLKGGIEDVRTVRI